jgi:hypothetical protein
MVVSVYKVIFLPSYNQRMASRDPSYRRYWFLTVDEDVKDEEIQEEEVTLFIDDVLHDPRGWKQSGYTFEYISPVEGLYARTVLKRQKDVLHLRISTQKTVEKKCQFTGLSCADLRKNVIYFNRDRWLHGSKESRMNIEDYRTYLVNHEIAHLLGRAHSSCDDDDTGVCGVTYQQTVSKGCCTPNPYPLYWE